MEKNEKIKQDFKMLALSIQRSVDADQLWRSLGSKESHEKHSTEFQMYAPFFNSIRELALSQLVINLARINDKPKNALNIFKLIDRIKKSECESNEIDDILEILNNHKDLWDKITTLRKAIAHSSSSTSEVGIFNEANITNNQISEAVSIARDGMIKISKILDVQDSMLELGNTLVKMDVYKLLHNLKLGREERMK